MIFNTYNPTKEDLIKYAPEGATHYQPPKDETYNGVFWKVSNEGVALEAWPSYSTGVAVNHFVYREGNASLELPRCIEIPEQGVIEENPTAIRERILEIRKERESGINEEQDLIDKLASMGFKLIEEINEKLEEAKEQHDLQDPKNWKAGDLVERISDCHPSVYTPGALYEVKIAYPELTIYDNFEDKAGCKIEDWEFNYFKFHSRPTK